MHAYRNYTIVFLPRVATAAEAVTSRPNVVLILTDDQGYADLSVHGNPHLQTPHIDGLALSGIRFERFFVNSFCAPTRAALLTGRYPLRCGVWGVTHNKECMRAEEVTLAESLRAAGYQTACIGKWHNGEQFPYTPPGQGFDEFLGFHNGHINGYFDPQLIRGAQAVATRGYITEILTDEAIRFVRENSKRSFFCYLCYNAPHSPYQVPDKYYEKFRAKGFDETVSAFYGMCENIDEQVGRLLAVLDEMKLAQNTIVVFLTDNGGTAGVKVYNAGMRGGKTSVHEGGCRVPFFLRWPARFRRPSMVGHIASHIDLYPTVLDLCGVPRPPGPATDGVSLCPLLEGRASDWPDRMLFTHNPISETNRYPGAVRTEQYRLVREIAGRQGGSAAKPSDASALGWQLYDMQAEPGETRDIAQDHPELVQQLGRCYEDWIDETSREGLTRFPIPVGYPQEDPVTLHAPQAYYSGSLGFFAGPGFAHDWLTRWTDMQSQVWFEIDVVRSGSYELLLRYACSPEDAGSTVRARVGQRALAAKLPPAAAARISLPHRDEQGRERYSNRDWGSLRLGRLNLSGGLQRLTLEATSRPGDSVMEFKELVLTWTSEPASVIFK